MAKKKVERQTVTEFIGNDKVPVGVRHWLERYVEEGEPALEYDYVAQSPSTMDHARLIYDVLNAPYEEHSEKKFSDDARDYVEAWLYQLAESSGQQVWNNPNIAVAAISVMIDCVQGYHFSSPSYMALETAITRLTTRQERRGFFRGYRYDDTTKEQRNREASFKLSRLLADPKTDATLRDKLDTLLLEFTGQASVYVTHPALAQRSFTLAADEMSKRRRGKYAKQETAHRKTAYADLMTALDEVEE